MFRSELHVVPERDGGWTVRPGSGGQPVSTHWDATEATRAALERADREGVRHVVIFDRYGRVRQTRPAPRARR
jgi:hypothetical protein